MGRKPFSDGASPYLLRRGGAAVWSFFDETEFIRTLGMRNKDMLPNKRIELLRKYLLACRKRDNWGSLTARKSEVLLTIDRAIQHEITNGRK